MSSQAIVWTPLRREITDVTIALNAVVTTSEAHGYIDNQWIRIIVPKAYGMDLFYVDTQIRVLSNTEFETDIDTRSQLPFTVPTAPPAFTSAQSVPISGVENNLGIG